jgi:hypothetical protein
MTIYLFQQQKEIIMEIKKTSDIQNLIYHTGKVKLDFSDKKELYELGFYNSTVNNSLEKNPSIETINKGAEILSKYYGRITHYHLWECKYSGFRIVYGY